LHERVDKWLINRITRNIPVEFDRGDIDGLAVAEGVLAHGGGRQSRENHGGRSQ
jgi:hypothetical protein